MTTQQINVSTPIKSNTFILFLLVGWLMPTLKGTTLTYCQQLLTNRKKHLLTKDVCIKKVPVYPETSVKECYSKVTEGAPIVLEYLPDITGSGNCRKLPEFNHFWTIVYTLCHEQTEAFIKEVKTKRVAKVNL